MAAVEPITLEQFEDAQQTHHRCCGANSANTERLA